MINIEEDKQQFGHNFTFTFMYPLYFSLNFSDNEVYAWGNNAMGQCGQGHTTSPVTRPKKILGLEGITIHQISAGTSHSIAWTALPTDRLVTILFENTLPPLEYFHKGGVFFTFIYKNFICKLMMTNF